MATVEMMRMGAIEERRDLNPRGKLNHEVVQEYVRRLQNGETPPPIEVDRRTGVLFHGAHRFNAYKAYFGEHWEDQLIPVVLRDDVPDPDTEPAKFRLMATIANRDNGLRVSRTERRAVIAEIFSELGQRILEYAKDLNETPESLQELVDTVTAAETAQLRAIESKETPSAESELKPKTVKYEPTGFPTSKLVGSRPVIRMLCKRLIAVLDQSGGKLTEAECRELSSLRIKLDQVLAGQAS